MGMDINNRLKGGERKMDIAKVEEFDKKVYRDFCPFCNKEFISLSKDQIESWILSHKSFCKKNPLNKVENVKN